MQPTKKKAVAYVHGQGREDGDAQAIFQHGARYDENAVRSGNNQKQWMPGFLHGN
jgi:hypothetical protein